MNHQQSILSLFPMALLALAGCGSDEADGLAQPLEPDDAPVVSVDRFGAGAMLQSRANDPTLPGPNEPIDFDREPFITQGLGPGGAPVRYYNFDVQSDRPAPLYTLVREGESEPVAGQLDILDVIPGMPGYSDFAQVVRVSVPADYVPNEVTSRAEIEARGYPSEPTEVLVNRPVVPGGSSATRRLGGASTEAERAWYRGGVVHYFRFDEVALTGDLVPLATIYVSFNVNPNLEGGGPASGFRREPASAQTHNVLEVLPGQRGYSPLWAVSVYDQADFDTVRDIDSVPSALLASDVAHVNCPVVALDVEQ
jgi:hypothetical protein